MTRPLFLAGALAAAHLLLVALGAAGVTESLGRPLQWYGAMSGANAGYSFFAPHVGAEPRVRFVLTDALGHEWEDTLTAGRNGEVSLRVGSMTGLFPAEPEAEAFRQDLAASWAATMFGRHPAAQRVLVLIEIYDVPSMSDYRAGHRPRWVTVYAATSSLVPEDQAGR